MPPHLLLVDDNHQLATALTHRFDAEGWRTTHVASGAATIDAVADLDPDLVILDLGLPDMDGVEVLQRLRRDGRATRVLVLSGRDTPADRVLAIREGADDFLAKSRGPLELVSRIEAALRRPAVWAGEAEGAVRRFGDIEVDLAERTARRGGVSVPLAPLEFKLLLALLRNADSAVTRRQLLTEVWGYRHPVRRRTVDTHIARLRRKLESDPSAPRHLITVRGVGYMLRRDAAPTEAAD